MAIGDRQPERFQKGQRLTASMLNTLVDAVLSQIRKLYGSRIDQPPPMTVILDAALTAVTNPKNPSSALATLCAWDHGTKEYSETSQQITVYNHSFTAYAVNTMGAAIVIDGHHWFFGDCAAMDEDDRTTEETPP